MKKTLTVLVVLFLVKNLLFAMDLEDDEENFTQQTKNYINKIQGEIIYVNEVKGFIVIFTENIPVENKIPLSKKWDKTISCKKKLNGKGKLNKNDPLKCLVSIELNKSTATIRLTNLNSIKKFMRGNGQFKSWLKNELGVKSNIPKFKRLTKGDQKNLRNDNILKYKIGINTKPTKEIKPAKKEELKEEKSFFDWKDYIIMILIGIIIVMALKNKFLKKIIFKKRIL